MTDRFNTLHSKPVRVHITIFFFFEVKVYTYLGKVRKIQVTVFAWEPVKSLGGNIAPPLDLIGLTLHWSKAHVFWYNTRQTLGYLVFRFEIVRIWPDARRFEKGISWDVRLLRDRLQWKKNYFVLQLLFLKVIMWLQFTNKPEQIWRDCELRSVN